MSIKLDKDSIAIVRKSEYFICKRQDMITMSRIDLSKEEQRFINYCISLIRPDDGPDTEYTFDLKQYYSTCGCERSSFVDARKLLQCLADKSWFIYDPIKRSENLVRWFNILHMQPDNNTVTLSFHREVSPFLFNLIRQATETGVPYTQYQFEFTASMSSRYGPRLYELLVARANFKNNEVSAFTLPLTDVRRSLGAETTSYADFARFRKKVIEVALQDIEEHSDIHAAFTVIRSGKQHKATDISFSVRAKSSEEIQLMKASVTYNGTTKERIRAVIEAEADAASGLRHKT